MKRSTEQVVDICAALEKNVIKRQPTTDAVAAKEIVGKQILVLAEKMD